MLCTSIMRLTARHATPLVVCWLLCTRLGAAGFSDSETWAFTPATDTFSTNALLDLRYLNETVAGEHGFIQMSADGDFLRGDGQPIRFWAVNTSVQDASGQNLEAHARFLAKRGVNMARFHGFMQPRDKDSAVTDVEISARNSCWRLVAAMKKAGIYTTISPYWANTVEIRSTWNVLGGDKQSTHGLLFFDPTLQRGYKAWLRQLYAETNTETGIPLAQDPAVAIIQLQNEDSLLFWTTDRMGAAQRRALGILFGQWLTNKCGSLQKAFLLWNREKHPDDAFEDGVVGLYMTWDLTQPQALGKARRIAHQLAFYSETMHKFNAEMERYLRDELGCKQLINAGNWRPADMILMNDAERWSYTANAVIGVNRYYTGVHVGGSSGWAIDKGDFFTDISVLQNPRAFPLNLKQVAGRAMIISESSWVPPLSFQSEGPFMVAAYSSLTGFDAFYWFTTGVAEWWQPTSANGYTAAIGKWVFATPELLGNFPAAALMFRQHYIARGKPVVREQRPLNAMWQRIPPIIAEDPGYDPNRDLGRAAALSNLPRGVNPLAFLIGPVEVEYDGAMTNSFATDLTPYIDAKRKLIKSVTGELIMDCGHEVCLLNAPKAQGVTGFLDTMGAFKLRDVVIRTSNTYATIVVAALDDQPLSTSQRVLVQVGTQSRPSDWRAHEGTYTDPKTKAETKGYTISQLGRPPWRVVKTDATVTIANPALTEALQLDANGMPVTSLAVTLTNGTVTCRLPANALYTILRRPAPPTAPATP